MPLHLGKLPQQMVPAPEKNAKGLGSMHGDTVCLVRIKIVLQYMKISRFS